MDRPATTEECLNAFGDAVVTEDWAALKQLLAPLHFPHATLANVESDFGWKTLEPLLRTDWSVQTGEPDDPTNPLAPPVRYRHYPVSQVAAGRCTLLNREQQPVFPAVDVSQFESWHEVVFEPGDDSGFDVSYQCEVALIDVDGAPSIGAYVIANVMD
jgi:hypothetical protein